MDSFLYFDKATVEPHKGSPYKEDKSVEIITIPTDKKPIKLGFWCEREEKMKEFTNIEINDIYDLINAELEYTRMGDEELLERCRFLDCDLQDALIEVSILQNKIATIKNYIEWRKGRVSENG